MSEENTEFIGFLSQREKIEKELISVTIDKAGLTPKQIKEKEEKQSRPITKDDAKTLKNQYRSSSTRNINGQDVRTPVLFQTSKGSAIDGFYYPIEHIETLMTKVTDIKGIYLAVGEYPNGIGRTLMLYGVKHDDTVHNVSDEIFDYSEPCPCKCPNGKNGHTCP